MSVAAGDLVKNPDKASGLGRSVLLFDMGMGGSKLDNLAKAIELLMARGYRPVGFSAFQAAGGMTQGFCLLIRD